MKRFVLCLLVFFMVLLSASASKVKAANDPIITRVELDFTDLTISIYGYDFPPNPSVFLGGEELIIDVDYSDENSIFADLPSTWSSNFYPGTYELVVTEKTEKDQDKKSFAVFETAVIDPMGFTENDPVFSAWDRTTGISITESQITDLTHFTNANETDPTVPENVKDGTSWDEITGKPTNIGDITGVTAGSGLTGGGSNGEVTLALAPIISVSSILGDGSGLTNLNAASITPGGTANINITGSAMDFTGSLGGDVTGTQASTTLTRLQGTLVSSVGPSTDQILKFNGSSWTPASEIDPEVGPISLNYVPNWNGSSLVSGTIYDNGNIGIGTTNPSGKLEVTGGPVKIHDGSASVNYATGPGDLYVEDQLEVDGSLYIGNNRLSSNASGVGLYLNNNNFYLNSDGPNADSYIYFYHGSANGEAILWWNSQERFQITDDLDILGEGRVYKLYDLDNTAYYLDPASTGTSLNVAGSIHAVGTVFANNFNTTSDLRLKENIVQLENAVEKVSSIRGVYFNYKNEPANKREVGVIAQEVEKVLPEVVFENPEGYKSVDYSKLTPLLIEAVKELKAQNDKLQEQNDALRKELKVELDELRASISQSKMRLSAVE